MKNILTIIITLCFAYSAQAQQPQIALHHNGSSTFYTSATTAMTAAQNGDTLYFPGGSFGNLSIDKQLVIYGAGIHSDSSSVTGVSSLTNAYFRENSSGSKLQGFRITYISIEPTVPTSILSNIIISKCKFEGSFTTNNHNQVISQTPAIIFGNSNLDTLRDVLIVENIIGNISTSSSYAYQQSNSIEYSNNVDSIYNIIFLKNIIRRRSNNVRNAEFYNNIFLGSSFSNVKNCFFFNNYFSLGVSLNSPTLIENCIFNNNLNLTANFNTNYNLGINNIASQSITNTFINATNNYIFSFSDDYHLKSSSPGKNAGFDGTDIGIYGTAVPTQEGWLPDNPRIIFKNIANMPDVNGNLPVQVQTRAVDNQ